MGERGGDLIARSGFFEDFGDRRWATFGDFSTLGILLSGALVAITFACFGSIFLERVRTLVICNYSVGLAGPCFLTGVIFSSLKGIYFFSIFFGSGALTGLYSAVTVENLLDAIRSKSFFEDWATI